LDFIVFSLARENMTRYAKIHQVAMWVCFGLGSGLVGWRVVTTSGWRMLLSPASVLIWVFGAMVGGVLYGLIGMWVARRLAGKKSAVLPVTLVHPSFAPRVPIKTSTPPPPPPVSTRVSGLPDGVVAVIRTEKILLEDGRVVERVEGTRVVEAQK
jgi:hypothetical protein